MTNGVLNFVNALAGTLSFLGWVIITARLIQFSLLDPELGSTIVPPVPNQTQERYRLERMVLMAAVAGMLFFEFLIDARTVYGRHTDAWASTQWIAFAAWTGKSAMSLTIARQFSVKRCGERGWVIFLIVSAAFAFFAL